MVVRSLPKGVGKKEAKKPVTKTEKGTTESENDDQGCEEPGREAGALDQEW